jgi:DNA (cytosine-5)-methyltransferase 1
MRRIARGIVKFVLEGKPFIVQGKFQNAPQDVNNPLTTITSVGAHELVSPQLAPFTATNTSNAVGAAADEPLNTVRTGGGGGQMLIAPSLIQYHSEQSEKVRGQRMDEPVMTVDAANRYGMTAAFLSEWYGNAQDGINLNEPMRTQTAKDREALTLAHIAEFKGQDKGQAADQPLRTITASIGEFGVVQTRVEQYAGDLKNWPKVREMLNKHCGYSLADDEVLLLRINGILYYIADIGLRMLTPRELFNAQGFPPDYIIDVDADGKAYPKSAQVARCGNAVCPPMAEALVRANLPELAARTKIETMAELNQQIAI